jgi:hypothetical protein
MTIKPNLNIKQNLKDNSLHNAFTQSTKLAKDNLARLGA